MRMGKKDPNRPPSPPEYREMHTKLGLLAIAVIINVIGFSVIIPLAPYYIKDALAHQGQHVLPTDPRIGTLGAWLIAVYALMQFLFAPVWGRISDFAGRKPLLMMSLVGDIVFYTLFGLAHTLPLLFAARILAGIFSSASLAIAQAYAADVTPPEHRASGLGMIGASFGIGFILGPAMGGWLGAHSLSLPVFGSALLAFINLIYIARMLPESLKLRAESSRSLPASPLARLRLMGEAVSGPLAFFYLLTFAVTFAFGNLEGTFAAYIMQHFGYTEQRRSLAVQGNVFAYLGLLIVFVQGGAIRPLVKRYGEGPLVVAGIGAMALGFLLFPFAGSLAMLLIGPMLPIAIGNGLNSPALRSLISRKSAATAQGGALGLSASFDSLARATGPAAAGWLYTHSGPQAPYWCAGGVMALCFLATLVRRSDLTADAASGPSSPKDEAIEAVTQGPPATPELRS